MKKIFKKRKKEENESLHRTYKHKKRAAQKLFYNFLTATRFYNISLFK